jgi:ankyrin repeat protein
LQTGESPLMRAARTGAAGAVKALLVHGARVNAREGAKGQTALMWAVAEKHPDVTRLLIEARAELNARTLDYVRQENFAGGNGGNAGGGNGRYQGRAAGPDNPISVFDYKHGGTTPLLFAARSGDVESARLLLAAGANVDDMTSNGMTALTNAIRNNQAAVALLLLEKDADPNAMDVGYAPLHAAVLMNQPAVVQALLEKGAKVNARITQGTPTERQGENPVLPMDLIGATPFFLAAKYTDVGMMKMLLAAGADIHMPLRSGTTPLMAAAGFGSDPGSSRRGADLFRNDKTHTAQEVSDTMESVTFLLNLGADVNEADSNGNTPLFGAVAGRFDPVVQLLVDRGARLDVKNKQGSTLLKLTQPDKAGVEAGDASTAELLKRLGARP